MCDPASSAHESSPPTRSCSGTCSGACPKKTPARAPASASRSPQGRIRPSLDSVTTFGTTGKRTTLYPSVSPGPFLNARTLVGVLLVGLFLSLPWIPIGGAPAVFLDVASQRFHLFGLTFLPQDLWLAFFIITGLGFTLFAITALWGRIWCGWACPLTVFLDLVRRVERWLEGNGPERKRFDTEPWGAGKILRRLLKHAAMGGLALVLAHGVLAYFVSLPSLGDMMRHSPSAHFRAFLLVSALTLLLWFNFAWFREQFCIVLCPYGRLQSVLTDEHSLVIGYDSRRGEPRSPVRSSPSHETRGDCIDCLKCVQVCPTGIDIRQGLQLECIGCAACLDACNGVMEKLDRPKGLIRYDSLAGLRGLPKKFWRPRIVLYSALILLGSTAFGLGLSTLRPAAVSLTRIPGPPYFLEGETLRNQFLLRIINKRSVPAQLRWHIEGPAPEGLAIQGALEETINRWDEALSPLVVTLPRRDWKPHAPLQLVITDADGKPIARKPLALLGPDPL
ncbi:MAG: cytochrome c oxidase accessory protein CcoG [Verrucomicrobiota bacterium]|jgi:cytochrome c oxidase accessory protein FixG